MLKLTLSILISMAITHLGTSFRLGRLILEGEKHEQITENGLAMVINEYYKGDQSKIDCILKSKAYGNTVTFINQGNAETDLKPFSGYFRADYHFDSETFQDSNNNVLQFKKNAKVALEDHDPNKARKMIGHGLHLIQDFYSHTNWVELGNTEVNPGVGQENPDFGLPLASPATPTCKPCEDGSCKNNLITDQLTSGYSRGVKGADGKPFVIHSGKCSHGGFGDDEGSGINKDYPTSDHGHLHEQAAKLAELATEKFIQEFRKEIGDEMFEIFLGLGDSGCK